MRIGFKMANEKSMAIVVLGWGSLCWDPRELRIKREQRPAGDWKPDGPILPIEFARISKNQSLTLVLRKRAKKIQVLWVQMIVATLDEAIDDLRKREGAKNRTDIGWIDLDNPNYRNCNVVRTALGVIKKWARTKHIDAVVWTDLPSRFPGMRFNANNVVKYLSGPDCDRTKAEEYVRKAPRQTRTRMRDIIEERLGWTHSGDL